jgi:hypothetical protein
MACLPSKPRAWASDWRRARHDAQRAVGKRHHALGVKIPREYAVKISLNEFSALDRMVHGDAASG